jgi:tetratricopeptide (TPR) repeat protein
MAHALRDAGQIDLAIAEYRQAVSGAPAYLPARVSLGTALYAGGKLDEAIAQWEEVVKADPQHRAAAMYLKLARSHPSQGGKGKSRGPR